MSERHPDKPRNPPPRPAAQDPAPVIDSRELLGGHQRVLISHEGRVYELRRTRLGKLILTR